MIKTTKAHTKIINECRKIFNDIFDKYQAAGFIDKIGGRKKWLDNQIDATTIYIQAKIKWNVKPTNFTICFSFDYFDHANGIMWTRGSIDPLLEGNYRELTSCADEYASRLSILDDVDKWKEFGNNLIKEIIEKTILLRFMYKKIPPGKKES